MDLKFFIGYNFILDNQIGGNMKFLFILLMFISLPAFSDVVGNWIYSGSGCRDESLDYRSHRSKKPGGENPVTAATFFFKADGTAGMDATFEDKETQEEIGTYSLRGDQIIIPEWQEVELKFINDKIIITEPGSEDHLACRNDEVFVYILSRLD